MTIQASELQENTMTSGPPPIWEIANSFVFYAWLLTVFSRKSRLQCNV